MITKLTQDLAVISKLGDNPGSENNLSTAALRAKFDEAALIIQRYINEVLAPALDTSSNPEGGLIMKGSIDMSGYKLTGLNTPVNSKDAVSLEFANKTFALASELTEVLNDIEAAETAARKAQSLATEAANEAAATKAELSHAIDMINYVSQVAHAALPQAGGTLTGPLILTEGVHYGTYLPAAGNKGRFFFKKV